MVDPNLGRARLVAQGLVTRPFATPVDAVAHLGAMQGQDLAGALASAALRTTNGIVDEVIADLDAGRIVRGYPMRGTVFLMPATDVLWVSELCNKNALTAATMRRSGLGLDETMFDRARTVAIERMSTSHRGLSRAEVFHTFEEAGTPTDSGRGYHVLAHLIGEGLVCFGPWNGSDQNVVLNAAWLPSNSDLAGRFNGDRIAAIATLLTSYLTSHGPATIRDFAWWTKLGLGEIRKALPAVADRFETDGADEPSYWRPDLLDEVAALGKDVDRPLLLPGFDEFILGYADRLFAMSPDEHQRLVPGNNGVFGRSVVIGGRVTGLWKRIGWPGKRTLNVEEFGRISKANHTTLNRLFDGFPFVSD